MRDLRRRTGARTGHAGTLDPFATGLLLLLSGTATKLASCFVGLDKRYLTDVDLRARTTHGRSRGGARRAARAAGARPRWRRRSRASAARSSCRSRPPRRSRSAASAPTAWRRRGVAVEMPLRRSRVDALDVIAYRDGIASLDLRVSSGTYVRAIADVLGGHCASAAPHGDRAVPGRGGRPRADDPRGGSARADRVVAAESDGNEGRAERGRARAAAAGGRGRDLRRRPPGAPADARGGCGGRAHADGDHVRPASPRGADGQPDRAASRPSSGGSSSSPSSGWTRCSCSSSLPSWPRSSGGFRAGVPPRDRSRGGRRRAELPLRPRSGGDLSLLEHLGLETRPVPLLDGVSSTSIRQLLRVGAVDAAARLLGRPAEVEGTSSAGDARGGTLGFPTANLAVPARPARARVRHLRRRRSASTALRSRSASIRTTAAASVASRRSCSTSRATSTADGSCVELWQRLRDERAFASEAELVAQIARDVDETRAAVRPTSRRER